MFRCALQEDSMKRVVYPVLIIVFISAGFIFFNTGESSSAFTGANGNWKEYQGGPERNQYSILTRIPPENIHELEMAWEYHAGVYGEMQTNPIVIDGTLYAMTADTQPFALNAATGEEYWRREAA